MKGGLFSNDKQGTMNDEDGDRRGMRPRVPGIFTKAVGSRPSNALTEQAV
jgi:hypothetical protein